jgi:hypothetical protein
MKTISAFIICMALASLFGGLGLWALGMDKTLVYVICGYGCMLIAIHVLMQDKIELMELECKNRNLYK